MCTMNAWVEEERPDKGFIPTLQAELPSLQLKITYPQNPTKSPESWYSNERGQSIETNPGILQNKLRVVRRALAVML